MRYLLALSVLLSVCNNLASQELDNDLLEEIFGEIVDDEEGCGGEDCPGGMRGGCDGNECTDEQPQSCQDCQGYTEHECQRVLKCVLCQSLGYQWDESGASINCPVTCANVTYVLHTQETIDPLATRAWCSGDILQGRCFVQARPEVLGVVHHTDLVCKNSTALSTEEGSYLGEASWACSDPPAPDGFGVLSYAPQDKDGIGFQRWKDGSTYAGPFKLGKREGYQDGKMVYSPSGDVYLGQWANDTRHGQGQYEGGGQIYAGGFAYGLREGNGEVYDITDIDNPMFVGEFSGGKRIRGRVRFNDGSAYEGSFSEDGRSFHDEQGRFEDICGNVFTGQWVNGRRNGHGIFRWINGDRYDGQFADDVPHGDGVFSYSDGSTVHGGFHQGVITEGAKYCSISASEPCRRDE